MEIEALVVVAIAICAYAAISGRAERSPLTPPLFFVAVGLTVGPWPLAVRYGAWTAAQGGERAEHREVTEMPVRMRHGRSARR